MKKASAKRYRKIKKSHIIAEIIIFALISILITAALRAGMVGLGEYLISLKMYSEYERDSYAASVYESQSDTEKTLEVLKKNGRDYLLVDKNNNILSSSGENSCSFDGDEIVLEYVGLTPGENKVEIYADSKDKHVYVKDYDGEKKVYVDFFHLISLALNGGKENYDSASEGFYAGFDDGSEIDLKQIYMPYWMRVPLSDGNALIFKANFQADVSDVMLFAYLILIVSLLVLIIVVFMLVDIIRKIANRHRLKTLFLTDQVTKGSNWMGFCVKGEKILKKRRNYKHSYAVVNLVVVKYTNYCMCHSVEEGDKLLETIQAFINGFLKKGEISAHYASDSFVLLMKYENKLYLNGRLELLLDKLRMVDAEHSFSFHIGVTELPAAKNNDVEKKRRKSISLDKEYNDACTARANLDESDDSGIYFFDDDLVNEQKWVESVQQNQQKALNNQEFVVYYQPKYNPANGELTGAEALIRWQSPEFGFVPPGRIIPIFEKNGFITEIDHYMITHAARDQKRWLDAGYKCVPVSVNVSRAHFIESDLAEQIRDMVDSCGTPRNLIEIELTESAFFDDKKAMVETIKKLKSYGFAVSMDDFGAGYSSLNSLKDMPLDVLKLDADFFRGDSEGNRGEIVVSEAIRLAKNLNMRTVAEGVEIKEQVEFLANQGCDMIQGYYYAKPMPGAEYEARMSRVGESEGDNSENAGTEAEASKAESGTETNGHSEIVEDVEAGSFGSENTSENVIPESFQAGTKATGNTGNEEVVPETENQDSGLKMTGMN